RNTNEAFQGTLAQDTPGKPPKVPTYGEDISVLESVAGFEDPPHPGKTQGQEPQGRRQADPWAHVGNTIEAPAEAADQVKHGIEQTDHSPDRRQDRDRIEAAAQKRQRRDHEQWDDLQLLEPV